MEGASAMKEKSRAFAAGSEIWGVDVHKTKGSLQKMAAYEMAVLSTYE